jgi:hypothetical protein
VITVPAEAGDFLPYVLDAAENEGYLGLVVVLARTAEARCLHEELTRDWTSIHDVTGHALAVLCPEPRAVPQTRFPRDPRDVAEEDLNDYFAEGERVHQALHGAGLDDFPPFDYSRLVTPGITRTPILDRPEQLQHAAWTEAVSRCAKFFGVPEPRLPALLVLCFYEENDVLIQLDENTSMYKLCKQIASHPGYPPEDSGLLKKRDVLRASVRSRQGRFRGPFSRMRHLAEKPAVRKQNDGLRRHLDLVAHADPDLVREVTAGLLAHIEADAPVNTVQAWLSDLEHRVATHPSKTELLGLHTKLRKLSEALESEVYPGTSTWSTRAKFDQQLERDQAQLEELQERLAARSGLAQASVDAARTVLGTCETGPLDLKEHEGKGHRHYANRIRAVWPVGRPPTKEAGGTRNTLSNATVYGPTVQARSIGALHVHTAGAPRPRRSLLAWLRGAPDRGRGPEPPG